MKRPAPYVPLSVTFATGRTGTAILDRYGLEGLGVWAAMMAAAKAGRPEGQIRFLHEEHWAAIGLETCPPSFTLKEFLKFLGTRKQTRSTSHGRVIYVELTRWGDWNDKKNSYLASQRSARYRAQKKRDDDRDDARDGDRDATVTQSKKGLTSLRKDPPTEEKKKPAAAEKTQPQPDPTPERTPNDVRDSAFRAYRAHGGNLKLEKERNALARGVTSLLTAGHPADIIVAAAADLGRDQAFPGYLKQRVEQIIANGGVCKNRGLDRSKLTVPELQACDCKGDSGCAAWAEALGAKA